MSVKSKKQYSEFISNKEIIRSLFEAVLLEMVPTDPRQPFVPDVRAVTSKSWDQVNAERTKEREAMKKKKEEEDRAKNQNQNNQDKNTDKDHQNFIDNLIQYTKFYLTGIRPKS
jgi:hypothetical protein